MSSAATIASRAAASEWPHMPRAPCGRVDQAGRCIVQRPGTPADHATRPTSRSSTRPGHHRDADTNGHASPTRGAHGGSSRSGSNNLIRRPQASSAGRSWPPVTPSGVTGGHPEQPSGQTSDVNPDLLARQPRGTTQPDSASRVKRHQPAPINPARHARRWTRQASPGNATNSGAKPRIPTPIEKTDHDRKPTMTSNIAPKNGNNLEPPLDITRPFIDDNTPTI